MSLPVIAIIVASVSALFTGTNMLVSALTYRRVRPRVRLTYEWGLLGAAPVREASRGVGRVGFDVHVKNLSPTAAKVRKLQLVTRYRLKRAPTLLGDLLSKRYGAIAQDLEIPPIAMSRGYKAPDMDLPAFGGLEWEVTEDRNALPPVWDGMTLQVILTNGDKVRGKWLSREYLASHEEELQKMFPVGLQGLPGLHHSEEGPETS
ncbi:hypothetical protein AB0L99_05045 [Streptomyces sp. NPDC051954]|uniref:hypothetical protein n=1 Tax=unclassified Streptomyces TaxID=2593676 RepID=UPI00342CB016